MKKNNKYYFDPRFGKIISLVNFSIRSIICFWSLKFHRNFFVLKRHICISITFISDI